MRLTKRPLPASRPRHAGTHARLPRCRMNAGTCTSLKLGPRRLEASMLIAVAGHELHVPRCAAAAATAAALAPSVQRPARLLACPARPAPHVLIVGPALLAPRWRYCYSPSSGSPRARTCTRRMHARTRAHPHISLAIPPWITLECCWPLPAPARPHRSFAGPCRPRARISIARLVSARIQSHACCR